MEKFVRVVLLYRVLFCAVVIHLGVSLKIQSSTEKVFKTISFPQYFRTHKYQFINFTKTKHKTSKQTNQSNETYRIEEKGM